MRFGQIEGTDILVLDPRFKRLFAGYVRVERLWTGAVWSEGPVWFPAGRYLVWSDIPRTACCAGRRSWARSRFSGSRR